MGMALWTPPAIEPAAIVEQYGSPEIFCDGGIIRVREHIIETLCYRVHVAGSEVELREVARIITPADGFDRSMMAAYAVRMGGAH